MGRESGEDDGNTASGGPYAHSRPRFSGKNPYISLTDMELSHRPAGEGAQGGVDEHRVVDHDPVQGTQSPEKGHVPEASGDQDRP